MVEYENFMARVDERRCKGFSDFPPAYDYEIQLLTDFLVLKTLQAGYLLKLLY